MIHTTVEIKKIIIAMWHCARKAMHPPKIEAIHSIKLQAQQNLK